MSKPIIIGVGEILWDILKEGKQLGGAPANFVYHCAQQGAEAYAISSISDDKLGNEIVELLKQKQVSSFLNASKLPTGTVTVELGEEGVPSYNIHENVAWDDIQLSEEAKEKLRQADAICFGSLAQRSAQSEKSIQETLSIVPDHCLKVFDINLRQHYYSKALIERCLLEADILKINEDEITVLIDLFQIEGRTVVRLKALIEFFNLKMVVLTMGSEGSYLVTAEDDSYCKTPKVKVADTIGAGDAFTATMIMGLLEGKKLEDLHQKAVEVSAFVCTQKGAMPDYTNM
ncbi:carbohydrate kinase [Flammeovirga sp. SJP92]|uniref:carbohydrate kinase family protein n=1 Tax=Flammeovirga sp. SJP92 TaxID=1775430 RepID=UPI0007890839|nr:carbohydrate kinase [Flammeovirga sp. SJP92]KXX67447.1 2-dehydro-3-deoxygluconokinase [Flammeovirga sp. SJP92]